jgi:hypothetical protein
VSDNYLRIIPDDPEFVPSLDCERRAVRELSALVPHAEIEAQRSDRVQFVDQGGNFERVLCPHCGAEITTTDWQAAMDQAWLGSFADLNFQTSCCRRSANLNDLVYERPAGFARFTLEVSGNGLCFLPEEKVGTISEALGCRVRQVMAHY